MHRRQGAQGLETGRAVQQRTGDPARHGCVRDGLREEPLQHGMYQGRKTSDGFRDDPLGRLAPAGG